MFSKKPAAKRITVNLIPADTSNCFKTFEYQIPEGGRYKITTISNHLQIFNKDKQLISVISFQAGYSTEFIFHY